MNQKKEIPLLLKLFVTMFYISAFTFGGGFVIVTFMKKKYVDELGWLDEQEMLDMTAMAQSCPGPIAVNAAILVGWRVAGFSGMLVGVIATILPPMMILSVISFFYAVFASNRYVALALRGMQAGVAAVILDVVWGMGQKVTLEHSWLKNGVMAIAFVATFFLKINVIYILLVSGVIGVVHGIMLSRKGAAK